MRSAIFKGLACLPLLALTLAPLASASSAANLNSSIAADSQVWNSEKEASDLLKQIKWLSGELRTDATTLESYNRQTRLGWQVHAYQLSQAREHINAIGERLAQLQALKPVSVPWQQRAIEEIVPIAANVAAHTQSAIQHLNDNRNYLYAPVYVEHLTSISAQSGALKESVDAFLEFGATSDKLDRAQQKLDRIQERIGLIES